MFLILNTTSRTRLQKGVAWNKGALDPDEIAHRREGVMLRHVITMMVKNLLDWADHDFALATASSIDRARDLYELAAKVLDSPDLVDKCFRSVRELVLEIVTAYGSNARVVEAAEGLYLIDDPSIVEQAVEGIREGLTENGNVDPSPIEDIVQTAVKQYQDSLDSTPLSAQIETRFTEIAMYEDQILKDAGALNNESHVSPIFLSSIAGGRAEESYDYPNRPEIPYTNSTAFCVPPNPVLVSLDSYIKLSLLKIQLCLDITGEPLQTVVINDGSVAEFFDTVNAEAERQPLLKLSGNWDNEPPRYRYSYLIEKARQYTDVAQRMGAALLTAQEKFDNEKFGILKAQHAIELASSTIDLKNFGLKDAVTGLELVDLQSDRAQAQLDFWQQRIDDGMLSDLEQQGIFLTQVGIGFQAAAAAVQFLMVAPTVIGVLGGGATAIGGAATTIGGLVSGGSLTLPGVIAMAGGAGVVAMAIAAGGNQFAGALQTTGGVFSSAGGLVFTQANFERRFEDWNLQRSLSAFDVKIAEIQKESANNRIEIANQELTIANLQNTQAREVLTFLENKFSNDHLYEWMMQVLSQITEP